MTDRIAKRVEAFRKVKGWSQRELATRCGMSVTTINHIERGGDTTLSTVEKIEAILDVKLY